MKLRKPCQHGRYDEHTGFGNGNRICPGGVFLPDDTLVIEKVDVDDPECGDCDHLPRRDWPLWALSVVQNWIADTDVYGLADLFDAISVREAE